MDGTSGYAFENTTSNWRTVHAYDAKPSAGSFPWNQFSGEISGADLHYLKGRLAATAQRSDGVWQIELFSYDDDGRLERRYVYTDAAGAVDAEIAYRYDRQGNLVMRTSEVDPYSRRFRQWYEYDERGLLERVFAARSLTRPAQPEVTYTYTATGAVASIAFRGSSALPYAYNSRDWLTGIGNVAASSGSFAAAYAHDANGQIAESEYRQYHSPATFKHYKYVYDYDRMGRLLGVDFRRSEQGGWTNASTFDVSELSYDANGNLLKLKRRPNTGGYIDNLSFAYTSGTNKLNILTDAAGALASWDASTMLYAYDQSDLPGGIRALAHRLPDL